MASGHGALLLVIQLRPAGNTWQSVRGLCYKVWMPKSIEKWLLYKYVGVEFTPLSKPFKSRAQAEKAREKYPERERKTIGVGVVRISG